LHDKEEVAYWENYTESYENVSTVVQIVHLGILASQSEVL